MSQSDGVTSNLSDEVTDTQSASPATTAIDAMPSPSPIDVAMIGGIVGGILALLLIIAVIVAIVWRRKGARQNGHELAPPARKIDSEYGQVDAKQLDYDDVGDVRR